jgi:phosphatidylinositol alpha-1,6-mannosyltransferase
MAGDGPLRHHLEHVAATAAATAATVFAGQVDEATKGALIRHCRALVMVSREAHAAAQFEGFGLVYLEAALAGRPSLAGRAGAAPEVVADEETGLLVEPDRPAQIADATLRLLDPEYADALGAAARERARATGTWAHAGERLKRALESALA